MAKRYIAPAVVDMIERGSNWPQLKGGDQFARGVLHGTDCVLTQIHGLIVGGHDPLEAFEYAVIQHRQDCVQKGLVPEWVSAKPKSAAAQKPDPGAVVEATPLEAA